MSGVTDDLDRYLRKKRKGTSFTPTLDNDSSWWKKIRSAAAKQERELDPEQKKELEVLEGELREGEKELEHLHELEEEVEERQEERASLYQQLLSFFGRKPPKEEDDFAEAESFPEQDSLVTEDFKDLAAIQLRWLNRLPQRAKEEFRESDDYVTFTTILERRGVAKRR